MRLCSDNSPNVGLVFEKGKTVTGKERLGYPEGTIFLDGAFNGAPFIDNKRRQYSLDHHAGCIRTFTLSACEQAATLIHEGMPLDSGDWLIVVNDIDLDSILAAWILMSRCDLIANDEELLGQVMPVVRLEGAIDAHGFGGAILSGLSPKECEKLGVYLEKLGQIAKFVPATGKAEVGDHPDAVHSPAILSAFVRPKADSEADIRAGLRACACAFDELDRSMIPASLLAEMKNFRETGRTGIGSGRIAVMYQSERGIYEAESWFAERLGPTLGLLILEQAKGNYTLRLVNRFMKYTLVHLYRILNAIDPAVVKSREAGNAWGGSEEIGGSPRQSGTGLTPEQILAAVGRTFTDTSLKRFSEI